MKSDVGGDEQQLIKLAWPYISQNSESSFCQTKKKENHLIPLRWL